MRLGAPRSQAGVLGETRNPLTLPEFETRDAQPIANRYTECVLYWGVQINITIIIILLLL